jgi:hypothetical protein
MLLIVNVSLIPPAPTPNCNNDGLLGFVSDPSRERVPGTGTGPGPGTCTPPAPPPAPAPAPAPGEIGGVAPAGGVIAVKIAGRLVDGLLEPAGVTLAGVEGPSCPWSSMCSRVASSCLHILHLIFLRGPPGVLGTESVGVRGNLANMSVEGGEPSPSEVEREISKQVPEHKNHEE